MSNCWQHKSGTRQVYTYLHLPWEPIHLFSIQKTCQEEKKVGVYKEDKDVTGSWVEMLKPQLSSLFANAELTKLMLLGRKRLNYLRLKKPQITECLILFRCRALSIHVILLWEDKHGILGLCSMTVLHINKTTAVSWRRWGERSRWKMEDKHQDKWILS